MTARRPAEAKPSARAPSQAGSARWLWALLLAAALAGSSYWYVRQPKQRQDRVQANAGIGLDATASAVGGAVSQAVEKAREAGHWAGGKARATLGSLDIAQAAPADAQTTVRNYRGRYFYAGMPTATAAFRHQIKVLTNFSYMVGYAEDLRDPAWVAYRLFKVKAVVAPPRPKGFRPDARTVAQVASADYTGSHYDRGHMAPNFAIGVCFGQKGQNETFLMSNVIPQAKKLNERVWENLEQTEIRDYAQRLQVIWIVDGPIFDDQPERLKSGVGIPKACYKILVEEEDGRPKMLAFIMPQDVIGTESPSQYLTSVSEIEKETGLDFLPSLPKETQDTLEAETAKGMW